MKSNRSFNARSSFGVPLPEQQIREADQWIITEALQSVPTQAGMSVNTTASPLVRQSRSDRRLRRPEPRSTEPRENRHLAPKTTPERLPD